MNIPKSENNQNLVLSTARAISVGWVGSTIFHNETGGGGGGGKQVGVLRPVNQYGQYQGDRGVTQDIWVSFSHKGHSKPPKIKATQSGFV